MTNFCLLLLLSYGHSWQAANPPPGGGDSEKQLLALHVTGPIDRDKIPLTRALSEVESHTQDGYVLFGIEVQLVNGNEPAVKLHLPPNGTLGEALRHIFHQLPGYGFKVESAHLIDVFPAGTWNNRKDALNLRIDRFDAVNEEPSSLIINITMHIPALEVRLAERKTGPPLPVEPPSEWMEPVSPKVTLHLRNLTVRDILNRISEASELREAKYRPTGWLVSLLPDPQAATGWTYSWTNFSSVPSTWKQ